MSRSLFMWFLSFSWRLFPVEWPCPEFNSVLAYNQVVWQKCLCQQSIHQWWWAQNQTQQVLVESKLNCLHWFSTVFDHCQLNDDCCNQDHQEQWVVEEVLENVWFLNLQLSCVNLVKDLEQHKNIEENWVMLTSLIIPFFDMDWWWNSENLRTWDK